MTATLTTASAVLTHVISGGAAYSLLIRAGRTLRLEAKERDACASTLILGTGPLAHDRLNVPDTLKAQHRACIATPMVLMSDGGLGLASVTGSSLDWHDCLCGHTRDEDLARFGTTTYQEHGNDRHLSARTGLLSELRKLGRDEADLHGCVNFFAKASTSDDEHGSLEFAAGHSVPGDWVELRCETDLLVIVAAAIHPLDPAETWSPAAIGVSVTSAPPMGADDPSYRFRPESARALDATRRVMA
jgi:uncharacterized protein YcgI (DUF1989 family)